ncbi:hypothetical protein [Phaeocystidibacter marisrubri]|uniref:Uncharacterized protein n=1 Tax=Phaeocystidibacter marisrubri TaxID=1577780 RepID=A0A6L3ZCU4_9FLAO|nr:hypothetical protein [Phaeocystidibacter marisrubri]KAB2815036.1 hypothetical protein F8C82_14585 [Phaeocystidibacter marisrubri]
MTNKQAHNWFTNVPGALLTVSSIGLWVLSYFLELKRNVDDKALLVAFVVGVVLVAAPQKFTDFFVNRFSAKK